MNTQPTATQAELRADWDQKKIELDRLEQQFLELIVKGQESKARKLAPKLADLRKQHIQAVKAYQMHPDTIRQEQLESYRQNQELCRRIAAQVIEVNKMLTEDQERRVLRRMGL